LSVPAAVFASGGGSNLGALLEYERRHEGAGYRIELVVSDREEAGAITRARSAGRDAEVVPTGTRPDEDVTPELLALLERSGVEAIFLAGYLRLLPGELVRRFQGRILNVHPALLPAFGGKGMYGLRVHRAVLEQGSRVTGVTVHFVNEVYDEGAVLAQWPVPVRSGDTPESLAARVLSVEHVLYPLSADHLGRALSKGRQPSPLDPFSELFLLGLDPPEYELGHQIRRAFGYT